MAKSSSSSSSSGSSTSSHCSSASSISASSAKSRASIASSLGQQKSKKLKVTNTSGGNVASGGQGTDKRKRLAANARERKRMHLLNKAYDQLRKRLVDADNKSKYDVLVQAKEYIQALAKICDNFDKRHPEHPTTTSTMLTSSVATPDSHHHHHHHHHHEEQSTSSSRLAGDHEMNDSHHNQSQRQSKVTTSPTEQTKHYPIKLESPQSNTNFSHYESDDCYSSASPCISLPDSVMSPCSSSSRVPPLESIRLTSTTWQQQQQQQHHNHQYLQQVPENLSCSAILNSPPIASTDSMTARGQTDYLPTQLRIEQQLSKQHVAHHQLTTQSRQHFDYLTHSAGIYAAAAQQYAQSFH